MAVQVGDDWGGGGGGDGTALPYYSNGDFSLSGTNWQTSVWLGNPDYKLSYPTWSFTNKYALIDYDWLNGRAVTFTAELRQAFRYDASKHYATLSAMVLVDLTSKLPSGAIVMSTPTVSITVKLIAPDNTEHVLHEVSFQQNTSGWVELCRVNVNPYFQQEGNYRLVVMVKVRAGQCEYHAQYPYYGVVVGLDDITFSEIGGVSATEGFSVGERLVTRLKMVLSENFEIGDNSPANTRILSDGAEASDDHDVAVSISRLNLLHSKNPDNIDIQDDSKFKAILTSWDFDMPDELLELNPVKLLRTPVSVAGHMVFKWTSGNITHLISSPDDFPTVWKAVPPTKESKWKDILLGYRND